MHGVEHVRDGSGTGGSGSVPNTNNWKSSMSMLVHSKLVTPAGVGGAASPSQIQSQMKAELSSSAGLAATQSFPLPNGAPSNPGSAPTTGPPSSGSYPHGGGSLATATAPATGFASMPDSSTFGTGGGHISEGGLPSMHGAYLGSGGDHAMPKSVDVDVTIMAYAQWLSEMKQQSTNSYFQQRAELQLMREAISANSSEISDFKRYYAGIVQQLQNQVSELRAKLSDVISDAQKQGRHRQELEQRHGSALSNLQETINTRMTGSNNETLSRTLAEQVERLQGEVRQLANSSVKAESELPILRKAISQSQEQTVAKFGEVEQALGIFRNGLTSIKQDMGGSMSTDKKHTDVLGQAITTLSQDFADFQKHTTTVTNKLQSDLYRVEEVSREEKDRLNRAEGQISGIQQSTFNTANELILLKSEREASGADNINQSVAYRQFTGPPPVVGTGVSLQAPVRDSLTPSSSGNLALAHPNQQTGMSPGGGIPSMVQRRTSPLQKFSHSHSQPIPH